MTKGFKSAIIVIDNGNVNEKGKMGRKMIFNGSRPTIVDVARRAGVSVMTVSRVLNNKPDVAEATRQKVLRVIEELGYVANPAARNLRGASNLIGLVVRDVSSSYIGEIIRGIGEAIKKEGCDLILYTTGERVNLEEHYVSLLSQGLADGLLIVLPRGLHGYLSVLSRRAFPYVLIDHRDQGRGVPSVVAANRQGAYEATHYLIQLGHRRIGFITGILEFGCARERLEGYKEALAEAGIAFDSALVKEGDFRQRTGFACAQELLRLPDPPTAIFASNDLSAFGAMEAIKDAGLRIPDDISVLGFDDIPMASHVHPPLTTVRQPLFEMGYTATHMLLTWLHEGNLAERRKELPTQLIVRGSCRQLAAIP